MQRLTTIVLISASLFACSEPTATPMITPSVPARAVTSTLDRTRIERTDIFPVPLGCTGEPVQWTIREELIFHEVIDPAGGLHAFLTLHDMGSSGVGLVTGAKYVYANPSKDVLNVSVDQLPTTETINFQRLIISQGALPNFHATFFLHYTVDANGTVTAYHDTFERVCN